MTNLKTLREVAERAQANSTEEAMNEFCAAFNLPTCLSLLDRIEELEGALTTLQGERDRLREALEHEMRDVATEASRYREALKMIAIRAPAQKPEVHEDLDNRGDIADQASALATWECSQIALAALQAPFKEGSERD